MVPQTSGKHISGQYIGFHTKYWKQHVMVLKEKYTSNMSECMYLTHYGNGI